MEEKYELAIEEAAMKLGCWGEKPVKKVILHFLEGNDVFVSLHVYTNNNYVGSNFDSVNFFFHIIILAINFFTSCITCFKYGLCNTH